MNTINDATDKIMHPHWLRYFNSYLFGFLALIVGIFQAWEILILGIVLILGTELYRRTHTYRLTSQGVSREYRFFATSRQTAPYGKIQNIEVTQSFIENIFGIGTIKFDTPGGDQFEIHFDSVAQPYRIEKIVKQILASK